MAPKRGKKKKEQKVSGRDVVYVSEKPTRGLGLIKEVWEGGEGDCGRERALRLWRHNKIGSRNPWKQTAWG